MKIPTTQEIARQLRNEPATSPPEGLWQRIQRDIPATLEAIPREAREARRSAPLVQPRLLARPHLLKWAAAVFLVFGSTWLWVALDSKSSARRSDVEDPSMAVEPTEAPTSSDGDQQTFETGPSLDSAQTGEHFEAPIGRAAHPAAAERRYAEPRGVDSQRPRQPADALQARAPESAGSPSLRNAVADQDPRPASIGPISPGIDSVQRQSAREQSPSAGDLGHAQRNRRQSLEALNRDMDRRRQETALGIADGTDPARPTTQPGEPMIGTSSIESDSKGEDDAEWAKTYQDGVLERLERERDRLRLELGKETENRTHRNDAGDGAPTIEPSSVEVADVPPPPAARDLARMMRSAASRARPPLDLPPAPAPPANDTMTFAPSDTNPFVDTEDDPLSTFGLDVDTGSYTIGRRHLLGGQLPPPESVRIEEYLNYFDFGDRPPEDSDFALHLEVAPTPFGESEYYSLLRIGIRARDVDRQARQPALLIVLVDISGSMARAGRLNLVKESLTLLARELSPRDEVGLVVYSSRARVALHPTTDHKAIVQALDRALPSGSTNLEAGLELAYEMAAEGHSPNRVSRVILCSDGIANVGLTDAESLLRNIADSASRGIFLTTVGFGMDNYNDELMERLADRGDGHYAYVDSIREARRLFVDHLTRTLDAVASDARVQVELNPVVVSRYRLLGYENRGLPDSAFLHPQVDAGEIGPGHQVTALYELKLRPEAERRDTLATVKLRYRSQKNGRIQAMEKKITANQLAPSYESASVRLQLAGLVAEFAEILRHSSWAQEGDLEALFQRAQSLVPKFPGRSDVVELVSLIGEARDIQRRQNTR